MQKRFGALRVIGTIFKILGIIEGILAILAAIGSFILFAAGGNILNTMASSYNLQFNVEGAGLLTGVIISILSLLIGLVWAITTYGMGDLFYLLIALEENTRASAITLQTFSRPTTPPIQ